MDKRFSKLEVASTGSGMWIFEYKGQPVKVKTRELRSFPRLRNRVLEQCRELLGFKTTREWEAVLRELLEILRRTDEKRLSCKKKATPGEELNRARPKADVPVV